MAVRILAAGLEQILARLSGDDIGRARRRFGFRSVPAPGMVESSRSQTGSSCALLSNSLVSPAAASRFVCQVIRLQSNRCAAPAPSSGLPSGSNRDQFDRQRRAFLEDRIETAKAEIKIRALLHKSARFGNRLLTEVGHFAKQLGRARLRRFRIDRQRGRDFRYAVCIDRHFSLRVELRDSIERAVQSEIADRLAEGEISQPLRLERIVPRDQRPDELRFRERFAHEIFRGDRQDQLRVATVTGGGGIEISNAFGLYSCTWNEAVTAEPFALFASRDDAITA